MKIDCKFMLEQFSMKDKILYYFTCKDISLAGDDYKVKAIQYFIKNKASPLSDYAAIKIYDDDDGFILFYAHTTDKELLNEALIYLKDISTGVKEIELRTPFPEIFNYNCFTENYILVEPKNPLSPIYFIHSSDELNRIQIDTDIKINLATEDDRVEVIKEEQAGHLDSECFGEGIFRCCSLYKNNIFILRVNDKIAGYLRSENGFANIYDIGWIFVLPEYRGHNYAVHLSIFFSD